MKFRDNVNWQLNLPCRATGSNKLSWEWRHNDSIIDPRKFEFNANWQLSKDGTLKAKSLSISDSGTYQCFVTDTVTGVKTFSRKLRVAVTGKIHKNRRNKSVLHVGTWAYLEEKQTGSSSHLSWSLRARNCDQYSRI